MSTLDDLRLIIEKFGIKEMARRSGLSPSTVSRVNSGSINPSYEVIEKLLTAAGLKIEFVQDEKFPRAPRLLFAKSILLKLRKPLRELGVKHAIIFGSVARGVDKDQSDVDIYLDFSQKPRAAELLTAEGLILEAFGDIKVDIVSWLESERGRRLKAVVEREGICVF